MPINNKAFTTYFTNVNNRFKSGLSTEHTYRGDLQSLLESIAIGVLVTNEPTRVACGAPDYIITKHDIPVGYIEAKDLGADLNSKAYKEQFERYRHALDNLIITNYLDYQLYKEGNLVATYSIGFIQGNKVVTNIGQLDAFEALIKDFTAQSGQTIKSSQKLAIMMANKAKLLAEVIGSALESDEENEENSTLKEQMHAFKDILIHDIKPKEFADIYAQTIAYGMFAARLHDATLETFTRKEAAELIPKSNPFLRKLFQYIAGYDLDTRIVWIVDALADIFRATDVKALLQNFGKATQTQDAIIHFYETFLSEYDPKLRKARGVWYTPEPVVKFIVKAVDDILKTEFGLADGLADTSKTKVKVNIQGKKVEQEVHRVQILDPATGTGTFLAEVVKYIYGGKFEGQQGIWSSYVEKHLIPRLNGFELLMASYAMAHLKLDMLLTETGYKPTKDQRLKIYLTNSLEEYHPDTGTLFAGWLSAEANEANTIKRDAPVMVVIGNPPYSGESANKGDWIMKLMEDYKKEPGGVEKLKERNPKWINDDYVKFLRYGQHFIEKNGEGILAFINPHGFLDNPTFRGMRWNLLKTYDKIYTIDLHGNSKKKETAPDGSPDVNVFDIQQGVSINLFIKTGKKKAKDLGRIYHYDLFGKRDEKYDFLINNDNGKITYNQIENIAPNYFFTNKNFKEQTKFELGFSVIDLFPLNNVGIVTARDNFTIHNSQIEVENTINEFLKLSNEEARNRFKLGDDVRDWQVKFAKNDLNDNYPNKGVFTKLCYRPFDERWTFYTGKSKGFHCYPRTEVMQHFTKGNNVGLIIGRQGQAVGSMQWNLAFITNSMTDLNLYYRGGGTTFPLYLYPTNGGLEIETGRTPNLNPTIVAQIAKGIGLTYTNEKEATPGTFAPIDILDYIYSVLHSPTYREKYKEFLKIDFPRVPYPTTAAKFWQLVALGGQLRQLHLLEGTLKLITQYPVDGSNEVEKPNFTGEAIGRVYINNSQYFDNVPLVAWQFYIGGYQPAQKWLKDRKGRALTFEDIIHYQKIIVALTETARLMAEVDKLTQDL